MQLNKTSSPTAMIKKEESTEKADTKKEEEKEQEDNKLRDLDGNEIKNDNVPQKGVQ